jgi:hypothetical protein
MEYIGFGGICIFDENMVFLNVFWAWGSVWVRVD